MPHSNPEESFSSEVISSQDFQKLQSWNANPPSPSNECVHEIIHQRSLEQPGATAICGWDGSFTYSELDEMSSKLAIFLKSRQVGPEVFVPILFEKSRWTTVAILGVMKAGGAFVLLDPLYPIKRLRTICQDLNSSTILSSVSNADISTQLASDVVLISDSASKNWSNIGLGHAVDLPKVRPDNALYVVFTSGSTGKPKGVVIEHRSFCTATRAQTATLRLSIHSRVLQFSSYAFDPYTAETLMTLMNGACLCVPSEQDRKGDIAGWARQTGVTLAILTPSVARGLNHKDIPSLETLVLGGEPMTASDVSQWAPHVYLLNGYGPSECTVWTTFSHIKLGKSPRNIGHGFGAFCWVVDSNDHDRLVPLGEEGELLIEGPIVGREYLHDPTQTAAAFIKPSPWLLNLGRDQNSRLYKTGDIVRYEVDGSLSIIGRKDTQIKIRGQRVELGDIENAIRTILRDGDGPIWNALTNLTNPIKSGPNSFHICVELIKPEYRANDPMLAAFISTEDSQLASSSISDLVSAIRVSLQSQLPGHMIPSIWIPLPSLPLQSSGKMDRQSLRGIGSKLTVYQVYASTRAATKAQIPPSTGMEVSLQKLWGELLHIPVDFLSVDDNFIDLGGDSLMAMRLVAAARSQGVSLQVAKILHSPVLRDMAEYAVVSDGSKSDLKPFSLLGSEDLTATVRAQAASLCGVSESFIEDIYPCSIVQMHQMYTTLSTPGAYMFQHLFKLSERIDLDRFRKAWETTIGENAILRTRMVMHDRRFFQVVLGHHEINIATASDLDEYRSQDMQQPMGIAQPLSRYAVIQSEKTGSPQFFLWTIHHALYDGHSMELLLEQVDRHYHNTLPANLIPYCQYVKTLYIDDIACEEYWQSRLADVKPQSFPPNPSGQNQVSAQSDSTRIVRLLRRSQSSITLPTIIRASLALILSKLSNTNDVLFGELVSGRNATVPAGIEVVAGPTTNPVPVRIRPNRTSSVPEYLKAVQEEMFSRVAYEKLNLAKMRHMFPGVVLNTMLLIQPEYSIAQRTLFEPQCEYSNGGIPTTPLVIQCFLNREGMKLNAIYDNNLIPKDVIEQMLSDFEHVLDRLSSEKATDTIESLLEGISSFLVPS